MMITIDVPPEIASQLSAEADRQGKDVPEVVQSLVAQRFTPHPYDPAAMIALLDSFDEGDADEQRETLEYLMVAIDRDRPGQRSIFGEGINPMPQMDEVA